MTLARKTVLSLGALTAVLMLATGAAIWALVVLQRMTDSTRDKFNELREVRQLEHHLAAVSQALADGQRDSADEELADAIDHLDNFEELLNGAEPAGDSATLEPRLAKRARTALAQLHAELSLDANAGGPRGANETLLIERARLALSELVDEFERAVSRTDSAAAASFRGALVALTTLAGVVLLIAMSVSLRHYRSVVAPLLALRNATRRIAGGDLATRMELHGDEEFVDLQRDFNAMGGELHSLYENLERRVAEQGRRLAISERLASVGYLAAGIAHEINNPLAIMGAHVESLLRQARERNGAGLGQSVVSDLSIVRDEVFRCSRITRELLDLSRAGDPQRAPVSMWNVLDSVMRVVQLAPQCAGLEIVLAGDRSDRLLVSASELELRQVVLNLAMNAVQAVSPQAGRIEIAAQREDDWVALRVRDNGVGMTPEALERAFEPFFTTRRGQGGMGLGLAVSHAIVRRHDGELLAMSDGPGHGSTFVLRFPARTESIE